MCWRFFGYVTSAYSAGERSAKKVMREVLGMAGVPDPDDTNCMRKPATKLGTGGRKRAMLLEQHRRVLREEEAVRANRRNMAL